MLSCAYRLHCCCALSLAVLCLCRWYRVGGRTQRLWQVHFSSCPGWTVAHVSRSLPTTSSSPGVLCFLLTNSQVFWLSPHLQTADASVVPEYAACMQMSCSNISIIVYMLERGYSAACTVAWRHLVVLCMQHDVFLSL